MNGYLVAELEQINSHMEHFELEANAEADAGIVLHFLNRGRRERN